MANTTSAKKAVRKIERRTAVNRARRSRMRTYLRKVEEALAAGDAALAANALRAATITFERSSIKSAFASPFGCFSSSGGISPEFNAFNTFCHRSAVSTSPIPIGKSSNRNFPFCLSAP